MSLLLTPPRVAFGTRDFVVLSQTILGEAEGEPLPGKVAVGWVIVNRAIARKMTIEETCKVPFQFSCWNESSPRIKRMLEATYSDPYYRSCAGAALLIMAGEFPDPTNGAQFYFTREKPKGVEVWPPRWSRKMALVAELGAHDFYKERV